MLNPLENAGAAATMAGSSPLVAVAILAATGLASIILGAVTLEAKSKIAAVDK